MNFFMNVKFAILFEVKDRGIFRNEPALERGFVFPAPCSFK